MRLTVKQDKETDDISVLIRYYEKSPMLGRLVRAVRACGHTIEAVEEEKKVLLQVADIYYFESVDKKTFAYLKEKVYRVESRLYQLKEDLMAYSFVQVSKSCLLNLNVLLSVRALHNSKMEAELQNGEKIAISRTYIPALKQALKGR